MLLLWLLELRLLLLAVLLILWLLRLLRRVLSGRGWRAPVAHLMQLRDIVWVMLLLVLAVPRLRRSGL